MTVSAMWAAVNSHRHQTTTLAVSVVLDGMKPCSRAPRHHVEVVGPKVRRQTLRVSALLEVCSWTDSLNQGRDVALRLRAQD